MGVDHSTTGIKTVVLDEDSVESFVIERSMDKGDWSFLEQLARRIPLDEIEMVANGFSMGNDFTTVTDIDCLDDRGIVDYVGLGHGFGTGTQVFDELADSDVPCVAYPGVHDGLDTLDDYFRHYSSLTGADTVAMTRYAKEVTEEACGPESNFVAACVSSSAMATVVRDGRLRGAFHWLGLIHGHVDAEMLRDLRDSEGGFRDAFMRSGLLFREDYGFDAVYGTPDADLLETMCDATVHHVHSLAPFAEDGTAGIDRVVLSGRFSRVSDPVDVAARVSESVSRLAPVHVCREYSTALGAAYIARDAAEGADDVLGIPTESVPEPTVGQVGT